MRCDRCGGNYDEVGFRRWKDARLCSVQTHASICIGCEQTERDTEKRANRAKIKARDTLRRHADRFIELGFATSRAEFTERFGWSLDRIIHDLEHTYENWCSGCSGVFKEMGHGLSDITLDICDPRSPPYYATNTRWICQTCNRAKGRTPPEKWGARIVYWHQWRAQQAKVTSEPLRALPLFDWQRSCSSSHPI